MSVCIAASRCAVADDATLNLSVGEVDAILAKGDGAHLTRPDG